MIGVSVAVYVLLGAHVLCLCVTQSTVGWSGGLDHKAGDLCGWFVDC